MHKLPKLFCSEKQVWELVSHPWLSAFSARLTLKNGIVRTADLISFLQVHYQSKKWRKQIESGCRTGITNQQKSVLQRFSIPKLCIYFVTKKLGNRGGGLISQESPSPVSHSILTLSDTWWPYLFQIVTILLKSQHNFANHTPPQNI